MLRDVYLFSEIFAFPELNPECKFTECVDGLQGSRLYLLGKVVITNIFIMDKYFK